MKTLNLLATSVLLAATINTASAGQLTHVDTDGISGIKTQYLGIKSGKMEIGRYTMQDAQGNNIQAFGLDTSKFGNPGNYDTIDWLSSGITDKIDYLFEKYLPVTSTSEGNGLFGIALLEIVWDGLFANSVKTGFFQIASGLSVDQITTVNGMIQDVQANYGNNNYDRYDLTYHTGTYEGRWNIDFPARSLVTWSEKVPEPATVLLFGLGLLGMGIAVRRKDAVLK